MNHYDLTPFYIVPRVEDKTEWRWYCSKSRGCRITCKTVGWRSYCNKRKVQKCDICKILVKVEQSLTRICVRYDHTDMKYIEVIATRYKKVFVRASLASDLITVLHCLTTLNASDREYHTLLPCTPRTLHCNDLY